MSRLASGSGVGAPARRSRAAPHGRGGEERWAAVDAWLTARLVPPDPALEAALAASASAGLPAHAVSPLEGRLLHLLARLAGARHVLELGTLGGYSAIWLARALPAGGRLVTLEIDPRRAALARRNLARAGLGPRVEVRVGPALETLRRLAAEGAGPFDLVFIDADKERTLEYFDGALRLSRPGTLVVVDNVVRGGAVAQGSGDAAARGMRRFLERLAAEPRVMATCLQTVGAKGHDGLLLARVGDGDPGGGTESPGARPAGGPADRRGGRRLKRKKPPRK